jgi:hypothetical protein
MHPRVRRYRRAVHRHGLYALFGVPSAHDDDAERAALHTVIHHRRQHDPATRDYIARRTTEGKSTRDAVRLLKRYLARHLYRVMQNATPLTT